MRLLCILYGAVVYLTPIPASAWEYITPGNTTAAVLIHQSQDVVSAGIHLNGDAEIAVVRHSAGSGLQQWRHVLTTGQPTYQSGASLTQDSTGAVFVATYQRERYSEYVGVVAKLSQATGAEIWRANLTEYIGLKAITVDGNDDVIVAGAISEADPSDHDLIVMKLSGSTGTEIWRYVVEGTFDSVFEAFTDVAVDSNGDVVAAGTLAENSALGYRDFFLVKLSGLDGAETWRFSVDSISGHGGRAEKVVVDSNGDVIAAGQAVLVDWCDLVVTKVEGTIGEEIWRAVLDEPGSSSCDAANTINLDSNDDVLVAAKPNTTIYSVIKYSGSSGAEIWRTDVPNICPCTGGNCAGANDVATDFNGDVVATGKLAGCSDITTVKLAAADGLQLWRVDFDLDGCGDLGTQVEIDASGDVVVGGNGFQKIDGACSWPEGSQYVLQKLTGPTGKNYWEGCSDDRDNDGDGLIDLDDPDCIDPTDPLEAPDTDGDGIPDEQECGDISGDGFVNTVDSRLIQRCAVGEDLPPICDNPLCDCTGEGDCNTIDARVVQRFAVGELTKDALHCEAKDGPAAPMGAAACGLGGELTLALVPLMWMWRRRKGE